MHHCPACGDADRCLASTAAAARMPLGSASLWPHQRVLEWCCSPSCALSAVPLQHWPQYNQPGAQQRQGARAWSLGSASWRHLTARSIASRQPNGCDFALLLAPARTVTSRPAARSATCASRCLGSACGMAHPPRLLRRNARACTDGIAMRKRTSRMPHKFRWTTQARV